MGFFDIFRKSVKKTKQNLSLELDNFSGKITVDTLEELEEILILADVGVTTAGKICSRLGERIKHKSIDSAELRQNLCEIVTELMEPDEPLQTETRPSVVLVVGVNGVGKTTSIGKLAYWLQGQGKKVLLGAADTDWLLLMSGRPAKQVHAIAAADSMPIRRFNLNFIIIPPCVVCILTFYRLIVTLYTQSVNI